MREILAISASIVLFVADAFAGDPVRIPVTNIPTLSEWGVISAAAGLMIAGVFFILYGRRTAKV